MSPVAIYKSITTPVDDDPLEGIDLDAPPFVAVPPPSTPIAVARDKYVRSQTEHLRGAGHTLDGPFQVTELKDALASLCYPTDAHFVTYVICKGGGAPGYRQPRLLKSASDLLDVREHDYEVLHFVQVADVDTSGHAPITPEQIEDARARLAHVPDIGWYTTRSGLRVLRVRSTPCVPEEYEAAIVPFLEELGAALGPAWHVDHACKDWTRHFRLPNVIRDGEPTRAVLDLDRMVPVEVARREFRPVERSTFVAPPPMGTGGAASSALERRARAYVAAIDVPVCGSHSCNDTLWEVALLARRGFGLDETAALSIVRDWASRSGHSGWNDTVFRRKVADADKSSTKEWGFMIGDAESLDVERAAPEVRDGEGMVIHDDAELTDILNLLRVPVAAKPANDNPSPAGPENESTPSSAASMESWTKRLLYTKRNGKKTPKSCAANVETVLRYHPSWLGSRIGYDEFHQVLVWLSEPPPSWLGRYPDATPIKRGTLWTDDDTTRLIATLNMAGMEPGRETVRNVIESVAKSNTFHPVREYLKACKAKWLAEKTRTYRLGVVPKGETAPSTSWLTTYLGAADTEHTRKAGTWWMVQAARRIFEPGALAKYILTLEGPQDAGKSSAFRILAGDAWFSDTEMEIGSLSGMLSLSGVWIQEISEGALLTKHDRKSLKGWISKPSDNVTPKFKNIPVKRPRQVTFAMTVNPEGGGYLYDPTGNVRFWPVLIVALNFAALQRDRDLLWGEAAALYEAGMVPEPRSAEDKKLFGEQVSERQQSDIWESKILAYVSEKTAISVEEVLEKALEVKVNIQQQREKLRVLDVLTPHGWTQAKERGYVTDTEGKVHRPRMYVRPGTVAEPLALGLAEVAAWDTLRIASWTESILPDGRRVWTQPMPEDALRNDV